MGKLTLGHIQERAPDVMLDAILLGRIGKILALLDFQLHIHLFPIVGDGEHRRGALHGFY